MAEEIKTNWNPLIWVGAGIGLFIFIIYVIYVLTGGLG